MAKLIVEGSGFPAGFDNLNGSQDIEITPLSLIWAAITVGAPSYAAALGSDDAGIAFAAHKGLAIIAATSWDEGQIAISKGYEALDQSEKTVLSYWIGMAVSKLVAAELLCVPWLQHARPLRAKGIIETSPPNSRSLPDLVGTDGDLQWHVIEAKGRQKQPTIATKQEWKTQAERVNSISSSIPATRSHCLTISNSRCYKVEMVDPSDGAADSSIDVIVSRDDFLTAYYRVFQSFLLTPARDSHDNVLYRRVACDPTSNLVYEIGASRALLVNLVEHGTSMVHPHEVRSSISEYIGFDGIRVRVRAG